ncbi:MAG: nondiscriminating aspartyl-tRNA synthetase [Microgenomates group bacterium Gr01-1014_5]|nr:MAG: nondiscriminating aspartyl-tRNA synthetase [Microgenomates group bacterium Gr01-1014_5]
MERTLITHTPDKVEHKVKISGWVWTRRDHGKIVFLDVSDRSGILQVVCQGGLAEGLKPQDVVSVEGIVAARPEKLVNRDLPTGAVELQAEKIEVLAKAQELPIDMGVEKLELQLPTLLDNRALTLRHPKVKQIFKVQEAIMEGFRRAAQKLECTEVFVPTISYSSTEGGAEVFKVDYYGHQAFMTQSPQLYKQIMVPVFERVYLVSHAYRSEPSITTRHLSESIQMDCELGFVGFEELLDAVEFIGRETLTYTSQECREILESYGVEAPKIGSKVPRLKMREVQEIVAKRLGRKPSNDPDLTPEDEREICAWALEEHKSDFVTVTHYPTKKRAFYSKPDPEDPEYSLSYDLLYRGVEVLSGSQRVDDYEELSKIIKERGMNPDDFEMYLQAFKYGMPPHGGFSFGLERMTMKTLNLANIREASLFPRDMERIDIRLSKKDAI